MTHPSIYEFAGGYAAFLALATAHHARCLADPELSHAFSHDGHPDHVARLAGYWAEVFGGPAAYSAACGSHSSMLNLHAGTGADRDYGDRFAACFAAAVDDAGLPDDPDFRDSLSAYMQWAVGEVMRYSPVGEAAPHALSMPRWSWDGLVSGGAPRPG